MIEKDPLTRNYELDKATQEAIARGNEIARLALRNSNRSNG